jgi:dihydrofolate reductase
MSRLSLIAAVASNGVIGNRNSLPWRLAEDLAFFKRTTTGHCIIMGRKTFESIGRALPQRTNIVVSRNPLWHAEGVIAAASLDAARALAASSTEVFVIGGESLYRESLGHADRLLVTEIHRAYPGDVYFPAVPATFVETERVPQRSLGDAQLTFDFVTYERAPAL